MQAPYLTRRRGNTPIRDAILRARASLYIYAVPYQYAASYQRLGPTWGAQGGSRGASSVRRALGPGSFFPEPFPAAWAQGAWADGAGVHGF